MNHYAGQLLLSSATAIAERAIAIADDLAASRRTRFALCLDGDCFFVVPWGQREKQMPGWVATFTLTANPDWLAEEIINAWGGNQ